LPAARSGLAVSTFHSAQAFLLEAIDLGARWQGRDLPCSLAAWPSAVSADLHAAGLPVPDRCQRGVLVKDPDQGADLIIVKTTGLSGGLLRWEVEVQRSAGMGCVKQQP
jgi:hypothetical protein